MSADIECGEPLFLHPFAISNKNEAMFESPWIPSFPAAKVAGIVGIEFTIEDLQCKYKISQNRPLEDRQRVIEKLELMGSNDLANAMKKNAL